MNSACVLAAIKPCAPTEHISRGSASQSAGCFNHNTVAKSEVLAKNWTDMPASSKWRDSQPRFRPKAVSRLKLIMVMMLQANAKAYWCCDRPYSFM